MPARTGETGMKMKTSESLTLGLVLGLISIAVAKIAHPNTVHFRKIARSVFSTHQGKIDPEDFANAVLRRNKEVFDRLAEM
ncbi:hypothetical protein AUI46_03305 [archaeon 13_1_40CM_2_52_13]|nr:MAG: hypothetical protein AUI46_03305 [archaeon 13_1_40CM_2_52_13]OLE70021.1 MAG: hypothetical protein AUF78_08515 [archaeon 13_1_20CM_2_51_12]